MACGPTRGPEDAMGNKKKQTHSASPPKKSPTQPASPPKRKDLFVIGLDFDYQPPGQPPPPPIPARVWAHPDALTVDKCPLIIYLHGDNKDPDALHQLAPYPFGPAADTR